ncbi:MAG: Gfo/Idh/MocA family oxidoreductase [Opitutaceae bacterium]|nr:Gfo/Idh/MocA family oxidoreductase [Opitutaceae bacterium]
MTSAPSSSKVRIGIIGMGIGRFNARAFASNPRSEVVALCDLDESAMSAFATELDNTPLFFTDYKEICACEDLDAIFGGTPNKLHLPVSIEAMKNGKHVLLTKPIAESEEAAAKLVEAAEVAGVVNMMSLSTRYDNPCQHLGKLVKEGFFGESYYARARSSRRSGIPDWNLGYITEGGGAFRDMGVHALDADWWLLGMPKPISATGVSGAKFGPKGAGYWDFNQPDEKFYSKFSVDDYAGGFIRFENGIGLQIESFYASHQAPKDEIQIELFGTDAGAQLSPLTLYQTVNGAPQDSSITLPPNLPSSWENIAEHFISCILDGTPCDAPFRQGWQIQQMLEALLESARIGKEVTIA